MWLFHLFSLFLCLSTSYLQSYFKLLLSFVHWFRFFFQPFMLLLSDKVDFHSKFLFSLLVLHCHMDCSFLSLFLNLLPIYLLWVLLQPKLVFLINFFFSFSFFNSFIFLSFFRPLFICLSNQRVKLFAFSPT